jgi:CheY-like chemotaxis protein
MDPIEIWDLFRVAPHKFDLVITDMTMPEMIGGELAQKLIRIRPDIPIVLCTGFSELIDEEKARTWDSRVCHEADCHGKDGGGIRRVLDGNEGNG